LSPAASPAQPATVGGYTRIGVNIENNNDYSGRGIDHAIRVANAFVALGV